MSIISKKCLGGERNASYIFFVFADLSSLEMLPGNASAPQVFESPIRKSLKNAHCEFLCASAPLDRKIRGRIPRQLLEGRGACSDKIMSDKAMKTHRH
ncbi:MAG: hypothetical protein NTX50_31945 [Candidatus Sumerlaeota bacterium]|nr:hypothetical protein [Candidatus Sumerlaeota bacterium]